MPNLLVERRDGVVTLTLNRPDKMNAITSEMWGELRDVFDDVATRADDRVLVITGAGRGFCGGADLVDAGMPQTSGYRLEHMRGVGRSAAALRAIPKPTIAKVNGAAAGAGLNLALGCDLVIASDAARFSEIFVKRGLSIDYGGSWLLPRLIGLHKAKELAFFADVIDAREGERLGIVNRIVPAEQLDGFVDEWAMRLAAGPPIALSMTKTMLNTGLATSMDQALEDEARAQSVNFATADVAEAMAAFVQKREPNFTGR